VSSLFSGEKAATQNIPANTNKIHFLSMLPANNFVRTRIGGEINHLEAKTT
jgi:hypothetical protein